MRELFEKITKALSAITASSEDDSILLNGQEIPFDKNNFKIINASNTPTNNKTITFIDAGQAELLKAPNFSLQFIRVYACTFRNKTKISQQKNEFYILTTAKGDNNITYKTEIFPIKENTTLINENNLTFQSTDPTIRSGIERADISKIGSIARRFSELAFAEKLSKSSDFILLDGTLEQTTTKENIYLNKLPKNCSALAKTASIFTSKGNSATALLQEFAPKEPFYYKLTKDSSRNIYFIKLNSRAEHIFRFETLDDNEEIINLLTQHSSDPVFIGYPYGLIWTDKHARISNQEASMLKTQFLLKLGKDINKIKRCLNAANAHDILDSIG